MSAFFSFLQSWLLRQWASLVGFRPWVINRLVRWGNPLLAAQLVERKFDRLAPRDERIASGDRFKAKWGFLDAALFLKDCDPEAAVAVLNQYVAEESLPGFRSRVLMELWLTLPHCTGDPETIGKIDRILGLAARANDGLIKDLLENGQTKPASALVSRIKEKEVPKAMRFVSVETGAYLLRKLRKSDPDWYEQFFGKLHAEYAEKVESHWNRQKYFRKRREQREVLPADDPPEPEALEEGDEE